MGPVKPVKPDTLMLAAAVLVLVASASAAPQRDNIFKRDNETGKIHSNHGHDHEKVPYTLLKRYPVSNLVDDTHNMSVPQDYEMRQYPSVKWACTEVTYEAEEGSMEATATPAAPSSEVDLAQIMQDYTDRKSRRNTPQGKMFMKLFR